MRGESPYNVNMSSRGRVALFLVLLFLPVCGCSSPGPAPALVARPAADFTLKVPGADLVGQAGTGNLRWYQAGADTVVEVVLDGAVDLKAFYCEVGYDPGSFTPVAAKATGLLETAAGGVTGRQVQLLEVADLGSDGRVSHGQVLAGYEQLAGFTGSGTVAVLRFRAGACEGGRRASTPPENELGRPVLSINGDFSLLSWDYNCPGDYDQNGLVTVSDLTPLGRVFTSKPPYPPGSIETVVDGDGNGLITVADITPIGQNYGTGVGYYEMFYTTREKQRPENNIFNWDAMKRVNLDEAGGEPGQQRLSFEIHQPVPAPNGWFWLCPGEDGVRGIPSASIQAGAPLGNAAPEAIILVADRYGETPMTVSFDASASRDSDGEIVKYEWDWEMTDNLWDWQDGGDSPLAEYTFHLPGYYYVVLRVTDDQGAMGWDLMEISVAQGPNQAPVAFFEPDRWETVALQGITFDASRSFDWDGEIVQYRWDFNSNGTIDDQEEVPQVTHAFPDPGTYDVTLHVVDDAGAAGEITRSVTIIENQPPVAKMEAGPIDGLAPLDVTFDPVGSYDPEGELAKVSWDLGGNRIEKRRSDGLTQEELLEPVVQTFYVSGSYECSLSVTDAQGQTSESSAVAVTVSDGLGTERWELPNAPAWVDFLDLAVIDGRLALAASGFEGSDRCVYYYMASDATATEWLDPVLLDSGLGNFGGRCNLALVNGLPAVTYLHKEDDRIYYRSAADIDGTVWNDPFVIAAEIGDFGGGSALATIAGNPAVAWGTGDEARYRRALTPDGSAWAPAALLDSGEILGSPIAMVEAGGVANICYTVGYVDLRFLKLADPAGTGPCEIYDVAGPGWGTSTGFNMFNLEGLPALMYAGHFLRPVDSSGQAWNKPIPTCHGLVNEADPKGHLVTFQDDLVAVNQNHGLYMCPSLYPGGEQWGIPQLLDDDCDNYHKVLGAAVLDDRLYLVFYPHDDTIDPDPEPMAVRVVY